MLRRHYGQLLVIVLGCGLTLISSACNSGGRGSAASSSSGGGGGTSSTPAALSVATTALPGATVGVAYTTTLAGSGGTTPYTWSLVGGALPAGISLDSASGEISGTPTNVTTASFDVRVTDAASTTADQSLTLDVAAPSVAGSGTWDDLANPELPSQLAAHTSATVGGSIFIIGGMVSQGGNQLQFSDEILEFDPAAGTVVQRAALLPQACAFLDLVVVGTQIFIIGGSNNGILDTCLVYDTVNDTISALTSMPDSRDSVAAAAVGDDIFVFGGSAFDATFTRVESLASILKYNITTDTWTTLVTQLPQALQSAEAVAFNGKIYVIGGGDMVVDLGANTTTTIANLDTVFEFDPVTSQITLKAALPIPTKMMVGDIIGSKIFVCSGERTLGLHNNAALFGEPVADTFSYDPAADLWTTLTAFTTTVQGQGAFGGRALTSASTVNGQLFIAGGFTLPNAGQTTPPPATSQGIVKVIARFTP